MVESTANALASMPAPKKAMTQTMGQLGKIRLRPSKRDFFRASKRKCASGSKIVPAADSLRGNCRPKSKSAPRHSAGSEVTIVAIVSSSASLRSVRTEMREEREESFQKLSLRGGNDARWKTPKASFPPRLEIGQKAPDSHIPTASTTASISFSHKLSRPPPHRIR
jgi:hypothetical protein